MLPLPRRGTRAPTLHSLALMGSRAGVGVSISARGHGIEKVVADDDIVRVGGLAPKLSWGVHDPGVWSRRCGGGRVMQVRRLLRKIDGWCYLGLVLILLG